MRIFSLLVVLSFLSAARAEEASAAIECPFHEKLAVSFTDWDSEDELSINLLGSDCANSVRVITLRDSQGEVLYTNSIKLQQLAVQPLSYRNTMNETLDSIRNTVTGRSTKSMPEFGSPKIAPENFNQGGEENRDNYERARAADSPLMCVRLGYESWNCFWYDDIAGYVRFLYLVGA